MDDRSETEPKKAASASLKVYRAGTHRVVSLEETLARIEPLRGPTGITRVANVTGLDTIGIPVVMVCRPNARSLAVSQGKGVSLDAARASGMMEAVELYHAERITLPLKLASWNELRFSHAIPAIESLPRVSTNLFHPDKVLLWIEAVNLFDGTRHWLPYELVHANYTLPFPSGSGCFVMSSNGLASGNSHLEAIIHALCELIERDATTLWQLRSEAEQDESRVDLETVDDAECRRLIDMYERAGILLAAWDVTSDLGVPAFKCVALERSPNPFRRIGPVEGMGCHPTREVALARALTEAAQGRLTLIAGARDDNGRRQYEIARGRELVEKAHKRMSLRGGRSFAVIQSWKFETVEEDLNLILQRLVAGGFDQALVVDLSKPEFSIPVVRVIVPGLETYHRVPGFVVGKRGAAVAKMRKSHGIMSGVHGSPDCGT